MADYTRCCFVIMPFGRRQVGDEHGATREVDFDAIYDRVFVPAIAVVPLPEGGTLEARRTDRDFFAGDISQDMFEYLEYSRLALADITGLNANVFYELGVRHRARQAGTAIFRQVGAQIPFDINQIKAFPYEYEPDEQAAEARSLITKVLTESLGQNRIDSPVQRALVVQQHEKSFIESDLKDAENAIRVGDRPKAIQALRRAAAGDPGNNLLHLRLGLLLKDAGSWHDALAEFDRAIQTAPDYAEAYREKGIAKNKLFHRPGRPDGMTDGITELRKAIALNPDDYDAHSSLGGALKRAGDVQGALAAYEEAVRVSRGHSYPLLNAIKLKAELAQRLEIDSQHRFLLKRAERSLRAQVSSNPPYDPPWSFFDLAEARLYDGAPGEFVQYVDEGSALAAKWQVRTFRESLERLTNAGVEVAGLHDGVDLLREREPFLPD